MSIETANFVAQLDELNPSSADFVYEGDDHLRLLKKAVRQSFPNVGGAVSADHLELSALDGINTALTVQQQLDAKAPLASPVFTGTPTVPTPPLGDSTGRAASTAFVDQAVQELSIITAEAAAQAALGSAALMATSATSVAIGLGGKSFTVQANKAYVPTQYVLVGATAALGNYMLGQVSSYSGTTLVVDVESVKGSGTFNSWRVTPCAPDAWAQQTANLPTDSPVLVIDADKNVSAGLVAVRAGVAANEWPLGAKSAAAANQLARARSDAGRWGYVASNSGTVAAGSEDMTNASIWSYAQVAVTLHGQSWGSKSFLVSKTTTGSSAHARSGTLTAGAIKTAIFRCVLRKNGSCTSVGLGIYDDVAWGATGDTTGWIARGPGIATQAIGSFHNITGLTDEPTIVYVTRVIAASTTVRGLIYPGMAASVTIGDSVFVSESMLTLEDAPVELEAAKIPRWAGPYLPTTTSNVTKADGRLQYTFLQNQPTGTVAAKLYRQQSTGQGFLLQIDQNPNAGNLIALRLIEATLWAHSELGTVTTTSLGATSDNIAVAISWSHEGFSMSVNGGAIVSRTATVASMNRLVMGEAQAGNYNDNLLLEKLLFWPRAMSSAQLQALSAALLNGD